MSLVAGLDKLSGDPHALARATNAALEQVVDAKFAGHLSGPFLGVLVLHGRGAGNHAEVLRIEAPELGDHLFGHAIGEIILAWISADVQKRQNEEGGSFR